MIDVALVAKDDLLDLELEGGDLKLENGLRTAILVSLFTDGLADGDDELPDLGSDRRGWWAGEVTEADRGDFFGSRIWLLERAKLTTATLVQAEEFAREALDWMVRTDVADRIEVAAAQLNRGVLAMDIKVIRGDATARPDLWAAELEASIEVGPARIRLVAVP